VVSAQTLTDMFNNVNGHFNDSALALNASGLRLSDYCPAAAKADLINYVDSIALYSNSTVAATQGVASVAPSSASPTKKYLLSPSGIFYSQVVKKGIMWALCAHQITDVYITDSVSNSVD